MLRCIYHFVLPISRFLLQSDSFFRNWIPWNTTTFIRYDPCYQSIQNRKTTKNLSWDDIILVHFWRAAKNQEFRNHIFSRFEQKNYCMIMIIECKIVEYIVNDPILFRPLNIFLVKIWNKIKHHTHVHHSI